MFSGYVQKRNSASKSQMQKVYCSLWGTLLLEFDNEEESKTNVMPRGAIEVIGVSDWDGRGNGSVYPHGLLVVTHTGTTHYISAPSNEERDDWILHIRTALECNFGNSELAQCKPSKASFDAPAKIPSAACAQSGNTFMGNAVVCRCCGKQYLAEYINATTSVLQLSVEEPIRTCSTCHNAQTLLLWLKSLNYIHNLQQHELTPSVAQHSSRFKATFKLRRRHSPRLHMAASLLEQGQITEEEYNELRKVDEDFRSEAFFEEFVKWRAALQALGSDIQNILSFLLMPKPVVSSLHDLIYSNRLYFLNVLQLLHIADEEPDLLDFFLPQLLHIHLLLAKHHTPFYTTKLDLLQQGIIALCLKYSHIALRVVWSLIACIGDYEEKHITSAQYAASLALLLQVEMMTYGIAASLADDVSTHSSVLQQILSPASHQKLEIMVEIYTLIRIRRQIHSGIEHDFHHKPLPPRARIASSDNGEEEEFLLYSTDAPTVLPRNRPAAGHFRCTELFRGLFVEVSDWQSETNDTTTFYSGNSSLSLPGRIPIQDAVEGAFWRGLGSQLDFIQGMTDMVDTLRFVDRALRTDKLRVELGKYTPETLGYDPTGAVLEPRYKISRVLIEDCRVFRTKARAPSLIICEVTLEAPPSETQTKHSHTLHRVASDMEKMLEQGIDSHIIQQTAATARERSSSLPMPVNSEDDMIRALEGSDAADEIADRVNGLHEHLPPIPETPIVDYDTTTDASPPVPPATAAPKQKRLVLSNSQKYLAHGMTSLAHESKSLDIKKSHSASFLHELPLDEDKEKEDNKIIKKNVQSSAQNLFDSGKITQEEYDRLMKCDEMFHLETVRAEAEEFIARIDGHFGETWEGKKERVLGTQVGSPWPSTDLKCFIVKSNDDLRQEAACIQLLQLFDNIFHENGMEDTLWLKAYRIVPTSNSTGVVEVIPNTMSLDALKKTDGFVSLPHYFDKIYGTSPERLSRAKNNYVASLAAYSLACYILAIKDRHNGNILIDRDGHVVHIDFGFLLGIAPGGSFSIESAPFKLTEEMVDVFGGLDSPYFSYFVKAFTSGFLALRVNADTVVSMISMLAEDSPFPCFHGKDKHAILEKLKWRFRNDLSVNECIEYCLELIINSYSNLGTKQYDTFQWYTNGITP